MPWTKADAINIAALALAVIRKREGEGLSQRELGQQLNVGSSTISRLESGGGDKLTADVFVALCLWLGAPLDRFVRLPRSADVDTPGAVAALIRADANISPESGVALSAIFEVTYRNMRILDYNKQRASGPTEHGVNHAETTSDKQPLPQRARRPRRQ